LSAPERVRTTICQDRLPYDYYGPPVSRLVRLPVTRQSQIQLPELLKNKRGERALRFWKTQKPTPLRWLLNSPKEALNKSLLDFSEHEKQKHSFCFSSFFKHFRV